MQEQQDHLWFTEHLAAHLCGGLEGDKRSRFDTHAAACPDCAAELERARADERRLNELFGTAKPSIGFEDRIITRLRTESPRRRMWIHPLVVRVTATAAAVAIVGGVGYVATQHVQRSTGDLRTIGQAVLPYSNDVKDAVPASMDRRVASEDWLASLTPAQTAPSSNAEKWDFGGGKNTAPNSSGWNAAADAEEKRLADRSAQTPADKSNHDEDGQNVLTGSGSVEFQANPFSGIQRDNIYARREQATLNGGVTLGTRFQPSQFASAASAGTAAAAEAEGREIILGKPFQKTQEERNETPGEEVPGQSRIAKLDRVELADQLQLAQAVATEKQPAGGATAGQPGAGAAEAQPPPATQVAIQRKVIRHGQMEFEVDSFDSAVGTITKVVLEETGFIATTNSAKLDNGKVKGTIVVRVAPDRLDTLVLKLRALGELKRQNLSAQDVTKHYTDLESELRAARAMEERLIDIIKTGKGEIKDLLAAEKELANWRGKIEKILGEINYYNNQIALSTLSIELIERNISTAAAATEQEEVNAGVETEDVESARTEAIRSIDEAKGRIIESELKKLDAGQFAAKIVAQVPQESAGLVIDRLRQLGKVARLDIQRKQTTPAGTSPAPNARIEQNPTRLVISLYNLANVAPRQTTSLQLACADVEAAYRQIISRITDTGGRVVSSGLNQQRPQQTSGTVNFEVKSADAAALLTELRSLGDIGNLVVTENPDTANVTTAKHGFVVQLFSQSQLPHRETWQLGVQSPNVPAAVNRITSAVTSAGGRVVESNQARESDGRSAARLVVDVPLDKSDQMIDLVRSLGDVRSERASKNPQASESELAQVRIELALASPQALVSADEGLWSSIRKGLSTSFAGLMWSLQILVVGLLFVVPWALVLWGAWKLLKRARRVTA